MTPTPSPRLVAPAAAVERAAEAPARGFGAFLGGLREAQPLSFIPKALEPVERAKEAVVKRVGPLRTVRAAGEKLLSVAAIPVELGIRGTAGLAREIVQDVKALAGQPEAVAERVETAGRRLDKLRRFESAVDALVKNPQARAQASEIAKTVTVQQWDALKKKWREDPWTAGGAIAGEAVLWLGPSLIKLYRVAGDLNAASRVAKDLRDATSWFESRPEIAARMGRDTSAALRRAKEFTQPTGPGPEAAVARAMEDLRRPVAEVAERELHAFRPERAEELRLARQARREYEARRGPAVPAQPQPVAVRTSAGAEFAAAEDLIQAARAQEPVFTARVKRAAETAGMRYGPDVEPGIRTTTVKTPESIGLKTATGAVVDDALRQTIVIPHPDAAPGVVERTVEALRAEGFDVVNVKNRFAAPERGYKDVNLKLVMKEDPRLVAEVQLITPTVLKRKIEFGHDLFDVDTKYAEKLRREIGDRPEITEIQARMERVQRAVYEEALAEDLRLSSRRRPASARTAVSSAAMAGERPAVSAERGLPAKKLAAISARRAISVEPAPAPVPATGIPPKPIVSEAPRAVGGTRGFSAGPNAPTVIRGGDDRTARVYPNGRATFSFTYRTTFGPNSAGFEERLASQEEALQRARQWASEGGRAIVETAPKKIEAPPAAVSQQKFRAETPTGLAVEGDYAVVPARDLVASHDTALGVNPRYPPERQPRMREKAASQQQLDNFVKNTRVEHLGRSDDAARGAPIVDGLEADKYGGYVVDSGNMRAIGVQRLYELRHPNAERYRQFVQAEAKALGIPDEAVAGIPDPVLVRVRRTPVDVVRFNREANLGTQLKMSAVEVARSDAQQLDENLLRLFTPSESGEVATAANRDFVNRFLAKVAPIPEERGDLIDAAGALTRQGIQRIQNAVLARAYGDVAALEKLIESPDVNVRNIASAMLQAAPEMIALQAKAAAGELYPLDIGQDVAQAMRKLSQLREEGTPVELYIQQVQLFGRELSPESARLLEIFDANKNSRKRIADFLRAYADHAEAAGSPSQVQLVARDAPTKMQMIQMAARDARESRTALSDQVDLLLSEVQGKQAAAAQVGAVRVGTLVPGRGGVPAGRYVPPSDPAVRTVVEAKFRLENAVAGLRESTEDLVRTVMGAFVYEPELRARPVLQNRFRLLKTLPSKGRDFAQKAVHAIKGDLGPEDSKVFGEWIALKDFEQELQAGRRVPGNLTLDQATERLRELDAMMTPDISRAIQRHRDVTGAMAADLVKRGVLPQDVLDEHIYFPHRVLDSMQVFGDWVGLPRRFRSPYRAYAKTRKGTIRLVNMDYGQVMAEHFAQVSIHNGLDDFYNSTVRAENMLARMTRQQKAAAFGTTTRTIRGRQVQVVNQPRAHMMYEIDGQRHFGFQYEPGRQIYPTLTTTERQVEAVLAGTMSPKEYGERVRRGLAMGRPKPTVLLPEDLYRRLLRFKEPYGHWDRLVDKVAGWPTRLWKGLTLNLGVPLAYNVNNQIGDMLNIAREIPWRELPTEMPRILFYQAKALKPAIQRVVRGKPIAELSPEWQALVRVAEENDVIASGLAAGEKTAAQLYLKAINPAAWSSAVSQTMEASRRLAYWKWALGRAHRGEKFTLSLSARELAGMPVEEAAGKAVRTALVDYQAVSPNFRRYVNDLMFPFSTWHTYNFINWGKYVRRNPKDALVKLMVPYVSLAWWNNTVHGDTEKDLPVYYRLMPHLVTGHKDSDGKDIVIVFQHPAHIAGQVLGLDKIQEKVRRYRAGELTLEEAALRQLKDTPLSALETAKRFANPIAKVILMFAMQSGTTGALKDPITKRTVVPERLRGTPQERALIWQWVTESTFVPLAQVYRAGREDTPVPQNWPQQWAAEALNMERAAGVRHVDVGRAKEFERSDFRESLKDIRQSALDKVEQSYIRSIVEGDRSLYQSGAKDAQAWYREEIARAWRQGGGGRGQPPSVQLTAEEIRNRLRSPRVGIAIVRDQLNRETDARKRAALRGRLERLEAEAEALARKGTPKGIRRVVPPP